MNIHFICRGNTFRSRLAEDYIKSFGIPGIVISSSGIEGDLAEDGNITWYAKEILIKENLIQFDKNSWTLTSLKMLLESDIVIYMDNQVFEKARLKWGNRIDNKEHEVWNIPDIEILNSNTINKANIIYLQIKNNIDNFLIRKIIEIRKAFIYPCNWNELKNMKIAISQIDYEERSYMENLLYKYYLKFTPKWKIQNSIYKDMNYKDISITMNKFPYKKLLKNLTNNVTQYVLWSRGGKLSNVQIENILYKTFPNNEYFFIEVKHKSIPSIWHCQVFVNN